MKAFKDRKFDLKKGVEELEKAVVKYNIQKPLIYNIMKSIMFENVTLAESTIGVSVPKKCYM